MMRKVESNLQKETPEKNPVSPKQAFVVLFFLSLLLNVYFLFFQEKEEIGRQEAASSKSRVTPDKEEAVIPKIVPKEETALVAALPADDKGYKEVLLPALGRKKVKAFSVAIKSSLSQSLCRSLSREEDCEVLTAYVSRLLNWKMDTYSDLRNGDRVSFLAEEADAKADRNTILAVRFSGEKNKNYEAFFFQGLTWKYGSYFLADGTEIFPRFRDNEAPIKGFSEITSWVGDFRAGTGGHSGVDFKAPVGTPVYAPFPGKVTRVNWRFKHNGDCIEIDHPQIGIKSLYLHLNKVLVKPGNSVKKGQKIGEAGNTGRSFAPHLHYELRDRNNKKKFIDPFRFKHHSASHKKILNEEMGSFRAYVEKARELMKQVDAP